jgi:hypothetical protein
VWRRISLFLKKTFLSYKIDLDLENTSKEKRLASSSSAKKNYDFKEELNMRTKDNKMIRIAGRNVFCSSTIPQNATDKLVLIFLHDKAVLKVGKIPYSTM